MPVLVTDLKNASLVSYVEVVGYVGIKRLVLTRYIEKISILVIEHSDFCLCALSMFDRILVSLNLGPALNGRL
jgi:hypothetical protein